MMIPKPNLTSVADPIIKAGIAVRELDPVDRCVVILSITEKGREVFGKIDDSQFNDYIIMKR